MEGQCFIAQISDIHIGTFGQLPYNVDVRKNFEKILCDIKSYPVDLIVITGDLAYRDKFAVPYKWIKDKLDESNIEYFVLAGNHDKSTKLAKIFDLKHELKNGKLYYKRKIFGIFFIFLDTSNNKLSKTQIKWLEKVVCEEKSEIIIFMHHPPAFSDCMYMDNKYPLKNREKVLKNLLKIKNIKNIFCGHYHADKVIVINNKINVFLTPSTFFQIDSMNTELKVESYQPGWRLIKLDGRNLVTRVKYLGFGTE